MIEIQKRYQDNYCETVGGEKKKNQHYVPRMMMTLFETSTQANSDIHYNELLSNYILESNCNFVLFCLLFLSMEYDTPISTPEKK